MKQRNCRAMTTLWLDANLQSCWARLSHSYLVLYALTRLQAGKDLALDGLDPQLPLLVCGRLKVPRLAGQWHNDELKVLLLLWKTQINDKLALSNVHIGALKIWLCKSTVIEAHPCTNAWWSGLLLISATLKWFLGTTCAPDCCCIVRWRLKIYNSCGHF